MNDCRCGARSTGDESGMWPRRSTRFFATRPNATWDFAAGPELHNAVLEAVTPKTRAQLRRSVPKDLVHQPQAEFATHFATH